MVEGVTGMEGVVGDEPRGGWRPRLDLGAGAMVVPERVGGSEWFRKVEGKRMVALGGQGGSGYGEFS